MTRQVNDTSMSDESTVTRLSDYQPPTFRINHNELHVDLRDDTVFVTHRQTIERCSAKTATNDEAGTAEQDLLLNGEALDLRDIRIDDRPLDETAYRYQNDLLTLYAVPQQFTLTTQVCLRPDRNLALSGLYRSNGIYCTQCEAEGFRRISFSLDRPDLLATYRVRIEGDKKAHPVMLSNGDLEAEGELSNGRHYRQWYDPHPKPSYLFALVAGVLSMTEKRIVTPMGKDVRLCIYAEEAFIGQTDYAMQALVDAFFWEEKRFNLCYDLNCFNVVAIHDFNMGAMENKSLNIFNTKYLLADTETATDADFRGVRSVIGHEYFHNWTGNRITCRDWFQLSLKEGLTVFRDQEFSADMNDRDSERIANVTALRQAQFAEDAGPLRHPVQPQAYAAIDNFYTATVYEKGAEIIRMYHTIIGEQAFQRGMRLYVERHDGQAVRIEEFAQCMEAVSGYPFTGQFFSWYTTAGTPKVNFTSSYDREQRRLTLSACQDIEAVSPACTLVIPIKFSLLFANGTRQRFDDGSETQLLLLDQQRMSWTYEQVEEDPIPVLMQGFSAPVYYDYDYSDAALTTIVAAATDGFARFEAMQTRLRRLFALAIEPQAELSADLDAVSEVMARVLADQTRTHEDKALLLEIPPVAAFLPHLEAPLDIDNAIVAHKRIVHGIARRLHGRWSDFLANDKTQSLPGYTSHDAGIRALRAVAMKSLAVFANEALRERFLRTYENANGMTERVNALEALNQCADNARARALNAFYEQFVDQPLAIDKWFAVQAREQGDGAFERIRGLAEHEAFSIHTPNRFRALIATLIHANAPVFHRRDGTGYRFVIAQIRRILLANPQLAARLIGGFAVVARLDTVRKALVKDELTPLLSVTGISVDVREMIERTLHGIE